MAESTNWLFQAMKDYEAKGGKLFPDAPARKPRRMRGPVKPTEHPTRTCKAVLARLRELGAELPGPDENYRITNLRTGWSQREAGAWSWSLDWVGDPQVFRSGDYGGHWPASMCAKDGATLSQGVHAPGASLEPPNALVQAHLDKRFGPRT